MQHTNFLTCQSLEDLCLSLNMEAANDTFTPIYDPVRDLGLRRYDKDGGPYYPIIHHPIAWTAADLGSECTIELSTAHLQEIDLACRNVAGLCMTYG